MLKVVALFLYFIFNHEINCIDVRVDPLVLTKQGLVRGQKATDGDYSMFLGIPYAKIDPANPFGDNLPPESYVDIFNAYDGSAKCPQSELVLGTARYEGILDCLRLNIYVPSIANSRNRLPVMVWIHGGQFNFGSAGEFEARDLVRHDIILVTINYRLGPYGFMCLDVPTVPGNQGLKDQISALEWIQENIGVFGGNANSITVSGQSAGAMSIDFHLYSSYERLFHKAIIQSGTSQHDGSFVERDEEVAIKIAAHLGFTTSDTNQALNFLSTTAPRLVTAAAFELNLVLRPCEERSFSGVNNLIESNPYSFNAPAKIRSVPILIGNTDNELWSETFSEENIEILQNIFYNQIKENFNLEEEEIVEAADVVRRFYIGYGPDSQELLVKLSNFYSDYLFNHPIQRSISKYIQQGASPIYEYVFSYIGRSEFKNITGAGAPHSEELQYIFNFGQEVNTPFLEEDQLIVDRITAMWANFVKFGNPTPDITELLPIKWEPLTRNENPYLNIDTNMRMESRIYSDRMAFWDLFFLIYGKHHKLIPECEDE